MAGRSRPAKTASFATIMITTLNSVAKGSGMPNHYAGDVLRTLAISGLPRSAMSRIYSQTRPSFGSSLLAVFFKKTRSVADWGHDD